MVSKSKTVSPHSLFQQKEEKRKGISSEDNMKHKGTSYITEGSLLYTGPTEGLEMNCSQQSMHLADVTRGSITATFYLNFGAPEQKQARGGKCQRLRAQELHTV